MYMHVFTYFMRHREICMEAVQRDKRKHYKYKIFKSKVQLRLALKLRIVKPYMAYLYILTDTIRKDYGLIHQRACKSYRNCWWACKHVFYSNQITAVWMSPISCHNLIFLSNQISLAHINVINKHPGYNITTINLLTSSTTLNVTAAYRLTQYLKRAMPSYTVTWRTTCTITQHKCN